MGKELLNRIFRSDNSNGFLWNAIGGSLFAGQSVVLLFLCTRFYDQETAGIISLSYAIATLIYMVALFGVRNFQVTDSKEAFYFVDYISLRFFSVLLAIVILIIYMIIMSGYNDYSLRKCSIIVLMSLLKMVNASEDVLIGRFQQRGVFVIGARIGTIREFVTLIVIIMAICLKLDIIVALLGGMAAGCLLEFILISRFKSYLEYERMDFSSVNIKRIIGLIKNCAPLCISTVLAIYLSNIPKYLTDWYMDELTQAIVGYLILPVFTIALLNQFIYTPFIKGLGDLWTDGDTKGFMRRIFVQSGIIILSSAIILLLSYLIGIPLLSTIYSIDLRPYTKEFLLLLIGGGLYALEYYLIIPVTVMHEQKKIVISYCLAIIISAFVQKHLVYNYQLIGVGYVYILVNLIISALLGAVIYMNYRKHKE